MTSKTWAAGTVIDSPWLQDVNDLTYNISGTGPGQGASLVGHKATETGGVATTVQLKLGAFLHAVLDFGCDNTGATNTTTAMKAAIDAAIASGKQLYIPSGDYLITAGVLAFDNGFVAKAWPDILTGSDVTFKRASNANAPMITISNGTANSGAGAYWIGGSLGSITFDQNGQGTNTGQHALSLRGISNTRFGVMTGVSMGGDTVNIPAFLFGGTNPDPYAVSTCTFEAVEANFGAGRALTNNNYVGFTGCTIGYLRAIGTGLGGLFGFGAGNTINAVSCGECNGWALDDGTNAANTGGSPSRMRVLFAEIDGCENGLRMNRTTISRITGLRFVHRYKFSPNVTNLYWPLTCIDLNGGSLSGSMSQVEIEALHRIEAAMSSSALNLVVGANPITTVNTSTTVTYNTTDPHGFSNGWTVAVLNATATNGIPAAELNGEHVITVTGANSFTYTTTTAATSSGTGGGSTITLSPLDALGKFCDTHSNSSLSGISVEQFEVNNAGFTSITNDPTRLYTGTSLNQLGIRFTRANRVIGEFAVGLRAIIRGSANTTIKTVANAAIPADTCNLIYDSELSDRLGAYDSTTSGTPGIYCKYKVPFTGTYRVRMKFMLTAAIGTTVNLVIVRTRSGANTTMAQSRQYQVNAGVQTYVLDDVLDLVAGDYVFPGGDQNTAGNIVASAVISQQQSNIFTVELANS